MKKLACDTPGSDEGKRRPHQIDLPHTLGADRICPLFICRFLELAREHVTGRIRHRIEWTDLAEQRLQPDRITYISLQVSRLSTDRHNLMPVLLQGLADGGADCPRSNNDRSHDCFPLIKSIRKL
jgi:hypothetical protein